MSVASRYVCRGCGRKFPKVYQGAVGREKGGAIGQTVCSRRCELVAEHLADVETRRKHGELADRDS